MKIHINTLGIIFGCIGSFLVWRYLTELNWADKKSYLQGQGVMVIPSPIKEDINKFKLQLRLSKLGMTMILIGGLIQIISNYLPE
jgi:hypothetical protein